VPQNRSLSLKHLHLLLLLLPLLPDSDAQYAGTCLELMSTQKITDRPRKAEIETDNRSLYVVNVLILGAVPTLGYPAAKGVD